MNEEMKMDETEIDDDLPEPFASAVCIFCKKTGCVDLLGELALTAQGRESWGGPNGQYARSVFLHARLVEASTQPSDDAGVTEHGVCSDCLAIEGTMNEAHMVATGILGQTATLAAGSTIATMAFLAHLICDGIENLDSLQDRLVSSKPLFYVLFPVLPPPFSPNPHRAQEGFDLRVGHVLASMLVQHSVPVACMAIMLILHAKAYESGENLETLQEALRWGEKDFSAVKGMLTAVQNSDARQLPTKLSD